MQGISQNKLCPKCKMTKDIYIDCTTTWREKNHARFRKYVSNYARQLKINVINHYGGICACCGETEIEFLTIDHIGGGGTKHREELGGSLGVYRQIVKQNYPTKYRVLCMNCNWATRWKHVCPHQKGNYDRKRKEAV